MFISNFVPKKFSNLVSLNHRHSVIFAKRKSSAVEEASSNVNVQVPDYVDVEACSGWTENVNVKNDLLKGMNVYPNFISETEEQALLQEIEPYLKRMRYEFDHWDDAIHGFRETERNTWSGLGAEVLQRTRQFSLVNLTTALQHTHVLDLDANGYIKPHVDAVRFCGSTVAGLCLLSPAVMRLRHSNNSELFADFLLLRRCLYIMKDSARYDFTHEILKNDLSYFKGQQIIRTRRISLINRSQPNS